MIKILLFSLIILFTGCSTNTLSPRWFISQNLQYTPSQIIGYGQAKDENEARQIAKSRIAEFLQVDVDTIFIIDKNTSQNEYSKKIDNQIKISTKVRLHGLRVLKHERVNGMWYVAIIYDNLPLFLKIIASVNPKNENFNYPYLKQTTLFKSLKNHFGFYPKAKIYAENGQYYIAIDNQQFLISQQEFIELFTNREHKSIEIKFKERLKHNELYFINTKFKEFGFASLFLVYEKGMVVNLFKNIELVDAKITYPNKKEYDGLKAVVSNGEKENRDMFVALLCKQKEDVWQFNEMSTKEEEDSFRFGDLIDLMGKCAFSTKVLTIVR
ncbi:hypothetical protein MNB_SV-14-958 [hydrothermal vent metagenome]|uniref:Lipoprotein n=1 Tax=hydrothermal vent metagenome TaxID=652676 RepID=A0A1W1BHU7_9ZZZZ